MDDFLTCQLLRDWNTSALIDLGSKAGHPKTIHDDIRINKNGTPVCATDIPITPNRNNHSPKDPLDARCCAVPMEKPPKQNVNATAPLPNMDALSKLSLSRHPAVHGHPRGTETYKKYINNGTERIDNRILNDYGLHRLINTPEKTLFFHDNHDWNMSSPRCQILKEDTSYTI